MTDTVLSRGRWHATPDGQFRLDARGPGELLHLLTEKANRKSGWKWVSTQATLAKMFQVSVRTIRYWISTLRKQGRILTEYQTDDRGYRSKTIFMLPYFCGEPRGKPASSPKTTTRSNSSSPLRVSDVPPVNPAVVDLDFPVIVPSDAPLPPTREATSNVADEKFGIDRKGSVTNVIDVAAFSLHNSGKNAAIDRRLEVDGSATQRVIGWWLKYRKVRPDDGEIAAMGRAVRECLTRSRNPYTVERAEELLFDLMRVGRDCAKIFSSETGMISRTLGRGRKVTWWQERKQSTVWSAVERPGLYRQSTQESRPSSPNWQPTCPSSKAVADQAAFEDGLIGQVESEPVSTPVRAQAGSFLAGLTSSLLYSGGPVDTGLCPYTDVRPGDYVGGSVDAW